MTDQIYMLAFVDSNSPEGNTIFQNWGADNRHKIYWYFSQVNNSLDFQTTAADFGVSTLPTVIAAKVLEEDPLLVEELERFEGAITYQKLNDLLAAAQQQITISIGGQGTGADTTSTSHGTSDGDGSGLGGKLAKWGVAIFLGLLLLGGTRKRKDKSKKLRAKKDK